jgi:catechol 2,3-dioxygenase-like lactoylglutathione lyase family enzyme
MRSAFARAVVLFPLVSLPATIACRREAPPASPETVLAVGSARVRAVGCVAMTVADADRSVAFFTRVLEFKARGAEVLQGTEHAAIEGVPMARTRRVRLDLGDECLDVDQPLGGIRRPLPADSRSNDGWFQHVAIVVRDMDAAYAALEQAHAVHASVAPQTLPAWNRQAGGIRAYYFKDPDGHTLEAIWFPRGKGDPRWQEASGKALFLGIDHTAVAARTTSASVRFYEGLGFHVSGSSENYGPEQERLNGVAGAHLRITSLRVALGPGIELLEYLSPRDGRPLPLDDRGDDVEHWSTTLVVDDARPPFALRDPDGHTMEIHGP